MLSASVTIGNGARDFKDAVVTARPGRPSLVVACCGHAGDCGILRSSRRRQFLVLHRRYFNVNIDAA
jgi:hypothetical protein